MQQASTAYYRTVDPIEHLVVRLYLEKNNGPKELSALLEEGASRGGQGQPGASMQLMRASEPLMRTSGALPAVGFDDSIAQQILDIGWQQKILGPREMLELAAGLDAVAAGSIPTGSFTPLQREYVAALAARMQSSGGVGAAGSLTSSSVFDRCASSVMIFTYTDRDGYLPPWERQQQGGFASAAATAAASSALPSSSCSSASLAAQLADPAHSSQQPISLSFRENPFSCMYVMAAVGLDKEGFRARRKDLSFTEVPLLRLRFHQGAAAGAGVSVETLPREAAAAPSSGMQPAGLSFAGRSWGEATASSAGGAGGGGDSAGTCLLEMTPGFSDCVPLTAAVMNAAEQAGLNSDSVLGLGSYGGDLKLRVLHVPGGGAVGAGAALGASSLGLSSADGLPPMQDGGDDTALLSRGMRQQVSQQTQQAPPPQPGSVCLPEPAYLHSHYSDAVPLPVLLEVHSFKAGGQATAVHPLPSSTGSPSSFEFSLINPDEDLASLVAEASLAMRAPETLLSAPGAASLGVVAASSQGALLAPMPGELLGSTGGRELMLGGGAGAGAGVGVGAGVGGKSAGMLAGGAASATASTLDNALLAAQDALAALLFAQKRALESSLHRSGTEFHSALPLLSGAVGAPSSSSSLSTAAALQRARAERASLSAYRPALHPHTFRMSFFLEIVAAARFADMCSSSDSVYATYQLFLPTAGGWKLLKGGGSAGAAGQPGVQLLQALQVHLSSLGESSGMGKAAAGGAAGSRQQQELALRRRGGGKHQQEDGAGRGGGGAHAGTDLQDGSAATASLAGEENGRSSSVAFAEGRGGAGAGGRGRSSGGGAGGKGEGSSSSSSSSFSGYRGADEYGALLELKAVAAERVASSSTAKERDGHVGEELANESDEDGEEGEGPDGQEDAQTPRPQLLDGSAAAGAAAAGSLTAGDEESRRKHQRRGQKGSSGSKTRRSLSSSRRSKTAAGLLAGDRSAESFQQAGLTGSGQEAFFPTLVSGVTQLAQASSRRWTFGQSKGLQERGPADPLSGAAAPPQGSNRALQGSGLYRNPGSYSSTVTCRDSQDGILPLSASATGTGVGSGLLAQSSDSLGAPTSLSPSSLSLYSDGVSLGSVGAGMPASSAAVPVAYLCYPLEFHLLWDAEEVYAAAQRSREARQWGALDFPRSPVLFFEVGCKGSWGRQTVLGYGRFELPLHPGSQEALIRCWKPKPSIRQEEAEFFLGSSSRMQSSSYAAFPPGFTAHRQWRESAATATATPAAPASTSTGAGKQLTPASLSSSSLAALEEKLGLPSSSVSLSRLGFETESSGELAVRCSSVVVRYPQKLLQQADNQLQAAALEAQKKSVADIIEKAKALRRPRRAELGSSALLQSTVTAAASGSPGGGTAMPPSPPDSKQGKAAGAAERGRDNLMVVEEGVVSIM